MNRTSRSSRISPPIRIATVVLLAVLLGGCYSYNTLDDAANAYGESCRSEELRLTLRNGSTLDVPPRQHADVRIPRTASFIKGSRMRAVTGEREAFLGFFPDSLVDSVRVLGVHSARYTRWYLRDSTIMQSSNANAVRLSVLDAPGIVCLHARVNESDSLFTGLVPYDSVSVIEVLSVSTTKTLLFTSACAIAAGAALSFATTRNKMGEEIGKALGKVLDPRWPPH